MSGYDKRVRVGVDADAAVDSAIDKLLKLKKLEDDLDGRKSTVTAKLKVDTSEVDKLQKQPIKIPAIIEAATKSSLSDNTKKNIIAQVKQIEGIINKAVSSGYQASFQALPKGLYTLNAQEVRAVREWTTKRIPAGTTGYDELYNQRYEYSRATKWALQQGENAKPINRSDFQTDSDYLEAVKAQERLLITYKQNLSNIKTLYESLGSPSSTHFVKPNNRQITAILSELSASVEQSKNTIASTFDFSGLQEAINTGNKDMAKAAMISIQETMDFITAETDKVAQKIRSDKSFNTQKRGVRTAINHMFENISEATADEARGILRDVFKDFLAGNKSAYDLSVHNTGKLLRSFAVYKNKGGTGLSNKELEQLNAVVNDLLDDPENGKFWAEAYPRLEEAIRNPVVEKPVETSRTTASTPAHTNGATTSKNTSSSKGAVYDHIVHSDYSTRNKADAIDKLRSANQELDTINSNYDIPDRSLIRLATRYKARQYYVEALKQGAKPEDLNELSPFYSNDTSLNDAMLYLKGMEKKLSFYSDIYSQIESFDSSLLSHHSVTNAADALAYQLFDQHRQYSKGVLTEDDLDLTKQYEDKLIKEIKRKSGKNTNGLYFIPDTAALRDSLNNYTSDNTTAAPVTNTPQAAQQEKEVEKAATAASISVNHVNDTVTSAVQNTTEKLDKMTESTERLGTAVQNTTHNQEKAAKKEKATYKVSRGPKLKSIPVTPTTSNSSTNLNVPVISAIPSTSGNIPVSSLPGTPNFDDMQLLAEKTTKNGQKITKVYKDVNRKVHTLTQTYNQANNTWSAAIRSDIDFKTLEQDSANTATALISNRQKLYAEMTKPQSQRDSGKIANLKSEIQRLQTQQQEQHRVARAYDQDPTSQYSMSQYKQQVAERMKPTWTKLRDQNNTAVNANKKAYQKEREETQQQKTQGIVDRYTDTVKQAQKLNQVNKEILDIQKQLDDKSNISADKTKLQSDLRSLKDQKTSLEKDLNSFKISDFISQNKDLLESQGKNVDEFDAAMRKAEKSNSSLRNYSQNKFSDQIISQYEDLMSGLSDLEKKNKELASAKSKGASNDLIKNLRKEIDQKQQELGDIDKFIQTNKNVLGENRVNAFNTQKSKLGQAEQNVYDTFQQDTIKQKTSDFTSQYDSAIAKVKELKQAYVDLYNIQAGGANGKYSKDELAEKISTQVDTIKALQKDVGSFYSSIYKSNQSNPNSILDSKKFDEYERALDNMFTYSQYNGKNNNIIELMKKAYSNKRNAENKILSLADKSNVSGDIEIQKLLAENYDTAYKSLRAQVKNIFGKDVAEKAISGIRDQANLKQDQFVSNGTDSFIKQIDTFVSTLKKAGYATSDVKSQFNDIKSGVLDIQSTFNQNRNTKGINDYVEAMQQQLQLFEATKEYYQSGKGSVDLPFNQIHERLTKYAKTSEATSDYVARVNEFTESYNKLTDTFNASSKGKKDLEDYKLGMDDLIASMKKFEKTSDGLNKTTSKGTMIENTAHQIKDTADASKALTDYAASIGLTNKISQSINDSTGKVTMNFETASGDIVKLTGNIEKANDSLRVMYENTTKASTGFTSFNQGIKGLVSGNFKGAINDIAMYVGNIQIMYKAINQMKQGFNTFMDYNKALTTIRYTMDMSQSQLQNLGSSAVDMAKDLSMSLDNTMDIYQIYANMNTTSKEIQETAKPTAILSNLSGVDASTAADQVQGILQQFHMLEDGSTSAADASMHVVDVMDKISSNVGLDYAKGIKVMTDAVQASGQVAFDAGMSYEQLAAISAKVAERTREDGSSIGNAIKTNNCLYVQKCA